MKEYIVSVADDDMDYEEVFIAYIRKQTELIRCKDCKHRPHKNKDGYVTPPRVQVGVYAWGEPEYEDDESCPYVCDDRWYSRIPGDEQYCDRAERKVNDDNS